MHIPVLAKEVIEYLDPKPNENFIDCTIGNGGHASAIIEVIQPKGRMLGIDWDEENIRSLKFKIQKSKFKNNLILANDNYANLKDIAEINKFKNISGILLDLGFSSWHVEKSGRGFSFQKSEPLDMRYDIQNQVTAEKIVNYRSFQEIEKILREYGEERFSSQIAQSILRERKERAIKTTRQLAEVIQKAIPYKYQKNKINPATKTFQALRIAVNDELNNLTKVLPQALEILKNGGRLAVISFHSLEDRIVKNFFRDRSRENLIKILTKKPITPTFEEIRNNPRSRSAKLRAA